MSFPFHLPKELGQTRRYDATNTLGWQTYTVPAGASLLHVIAVSGGPRIGGFGPHHGAVQSVARNALYACRSGRSDRSRRQHGCLCAADARFLELYRGGQWRFCGRKRVGGGGRGCGGWGGRGRGSLHGTGGVWVGCRTCRRSWWRGRRGRWHNAKLWRSFEHLFVRWGRGGRHHLG
jgi:hypothetical protein